jgi:hypothetical protein
MRRGGALRHPDRSTPRLGSRFAVGTGHLCQIKFWLMHISRCSSAAVSFGGSTETVGLSILPVNVNGMQPRSDRSVRPPACNFHVDGAGTSGLPVFPSLDRDDVLLLLAV